MIPPYLVYGLLAGSLLIPSELLSLSHVNGAIAWSAACLLLLLGLCCGGVIQLVESVLARLVHLPRAPVRALPALLPLILVSRHLFDGGLASTLPGSASAPLWLPALGYLLLCSALSIAPPLLTTALRKRAAALALVLLALLLETANRRLYYSEYPDIHTFLLFVNVVLGIVALHLLSGTLGRPLPAWSRGHVLLLIVLGIVLIPGLSYGIKDKHSRLVIATSGLHTRHLLRLVRSILPQRTMEIAVPSPNQLTLLSQTSSSSATEGLGEFLVSPRVAEILSRTSRQNILVISIDALRADLLASNEQNHRDFPNLLSLLGSSRTFRYAFSPASGTDLSLGCVLTGVVNPFVPVAKTLFEAIADTGRLTHAILPREVLRWAGEALLVRGLHSYDRLITDPSERDVGSHTTSRRTTDLGLEFVDRHQSAWWSRRFFLWLHYFDVHEHDQIKETDASLVAVMGRAPGTRVQKYRALLKILDADLARLFQGLKDRGLWESTMVLLFSDHGESLGDDRRLPRNHGHFVYNPLIHVPVALRVPGISPKVLTAPISLIDIMPTMLHLAGAEVPPGLDGVALLPQILDGPPQLFSKPRPIVVNESEQYGLVLWPYKLLVRPADGISELYDLDHDFAETNDLSEIDPFKVSALEALYRRFPRVMMDRSAQGRRLRERIAQQRPSP